MKKIAMIMVILTVFSLTAAAQIPKNFKGQTLQTEVLPKPKKDSVVNIEPIAGRAGDILLLSTRDGKIGVNANVNSDTLRISAAGVFGLQDRDTFSYINVATVKQLSEQIKQGRYPIYLTMDQIIGMFTYLRTSKNAEFTDVQMDQLKAPLIPWVQAWQQAQQSQQKPK